MTEHVEQEVRNKMLQFWQEHSQNGDLTEMLLDTKADTISDIEVNEIVKLLPNLKTKRVLELGAGIG